MLRQWSRSVYALAHWVWFPALWLFIGTVSAFDTYLTVRFQDLMSVIERNALGRYLIELDSGGVGLFVRTKILGTIVVLTALVGIRVYRRRWALPVTLALAGFQFGLLGYLALSEPVLQRRPTNVSATIAAALPPARTVWEDLAYFLPQANARSDR
jgi:hypothetical protein